LSLEGLLEEALEQGGWEAVSKFAQQCGGESALSASGPLLVLPSSVCDEANPARFGLFVLGQHLAERFHAFQSSYPQIGDVRGLGPMIAMELVKDRQTKEPASDLTQQILDTARSHGLLLMKAGLYGNVIRVLVPLVATEKDIDEALQILGSALEEVLRTGQTSDAQQSAVREVK